MPTHHTSNLNRVRKSFWIDRAPDRTPVPALTRDTDTDLLVIGGGYSGLWTALHAKERDPNRHVILLEGKTIGHAASGRNGGFVEPSITHGLSNAIARWPEQAAELVQLSRENFHGMREDIERYGIDCDWREGGSLTFARTETEAADLREAAEDGQRYGEPAEFIGPANIAAVTASPAYRAALRSPEVATVDPYRLALGLFEACRNAGVEVYEHSIAEELDSRDERIRVTTRNGAVVAAMQVALATNAYPALLRRLRPVTVPVYDYALMTEPLSEEQFAAIGWPGDEGLSDASNFFHYYRKTDDGRILWGGYDAIYHFGSRKSEALTQREATFATLERHFRETYPQLAEVRFTHQWGGIIDTSTQFSLTAGLASRGRVAYALGYTGLGVAATRFGADVMLDLLAGKRTRRTQIEMIRRKPLPFPPEPFRAIGIHLTQWSMARADKTGRRNLWLRLMDAVGLGFDS